MIPAEDSLEAQKFYLGEALTTECEVAVDGHAGFGLCLGEEPVRCYCITWDGAAVVAWGWVAGVVAARAVPRSNASESASLT
jgi:hypothetical protein